MSQSNYYKRLPGLRFLLVPAMVLVFSSLHPQSGSSGDSRPPRPGTKPAPWVGGYNSRQAGLEDGPGEARVYKLSHLRRLRRAVPPRYVRVVDWRHYGMTGKTLNKGILFTYRDYRARMVYLSGNFNNWSLLPMYRNSFGVFYYILPIREVERGVRFNSSDFTYKYKFRVDGIWVHDPSNKLRVDDGLGGYMSEFRPRGEDINRRISVRVLKEKTRRDERLVEFAVYLPNVKNLSLVGNFNNWNPEHDFLVKGKDGIFRLRLRLKPGKYVYKYIADGRWILDRYNSQTRHKRVRFNEYTGKYEGFGELCSFINVE